jgi:hypothetical protein
MRDVVPVRPDVAVIRKHGEPDSARLEVLAQERRLGGPIRRLSEAIEGRTPRATESR